ncbi:2055_t:CDS:2, partial [Funneliformis mosseae]
NGIIKAANTFELDKVVEGIFDEFDLSILFVCLACIESLAVRRGMLCMFSVELEVERTMLSIFMLTVFFFSVRCLVVVIS